MASPGHPAPLTEPEIAELAAVLRSWRQPWWWRLRRRVAFFVAFDLGWIGLGYLIDVDRDRHAADNLDTIYDLDRD